MKENIMSPRVFTRIFLVVLAVSAFALPTRAQNDARSKSTTESTGAATTPRATKAAAVNPKYTTPKSALDTAYGAKIAEYTTEKYFMTELVDHLPLSDKVPSPEKVLGYAIGTPNKLTYTKDLRSEEHTSELQSLAYLVCRLPLEKKKADTRARLGPRGSRPGRR